MIPGILAVMLIAVTSIIMAMGIAREREAGTLEQVLVTPIRPLVLLVGKCVPFILFGLIDITAVLLIGSWLFHLPMRGPIALVGLASFLYLFSTLGVGIVLSTVSANQQQAMLGSTAFMMPAVLLSGFLSPISTMPAWLQPITYLNPLRYFIDIVRSCLLKGAGFDDVKWQLGSLALLGVCLLTFAVLRFRKRVA
jgi:ABC-2 type transport system permease protein